MKFILMESISSFIKVVESSSGVNTIPQIKIIQDPNWYLILLPMITIVLVIAAFFTSRNQLREETKKFISKIDREIATRTKQQWINELRNEISNFLSTMKTIDNLNLIKEEDEEVIIKIIEESNNLFTSKSKINLYLEPNDETSKILLELLESIISRIIENKICNEDYMEVISLTQSILSIASSWNEIND